MSRWCSNQLSYVPAVGRHSTHLAEAVNCKIEENLQKNQRLQKARGGRQGKLNTGRPVPGNRNEPSAFMDEATARGIRSRIGQGFGQGRVHGALPAANGAARGVDGRGTVLPASWIHRPRTVLQRRTPELRVPHERTGATGYRLRRSGCKAGRNPWRAFRHYRLGDLRCTNIPAAA
ncbi:hypothetical protein COLO4_01878 [Corchorus olitorius]|uniref:Uncharacterized protein n=1 Tax=Corchorus olitorius TaxID=93759 RepID=A0A1R3L212_9ROSI|nr:hypothetical protein COLO4_01878 [Corchorus olitorius]